MKTINGILTTSWLLCALLMIILTKIYRPDSDWIFPTFLLQTIASFIMYIIIVLANKLVIERKLVIYSIAFLFSYIILTLILWKINNNENGYLAFLLKIHSSRDFIILLFPYLISHILLICVSAAVNKVMEYDY